MKSSFFALLLGFLMAIPVFAQDCKFSEAIEKLYSDCLSMGVSTETLKIEHGVLMLMTAKNANDGKAIFNQAKSVQTLIGKEKIVNCGAYQELAELLQNKKVRSDVSSVSNGAIVMIVSDDAELTKKLQEMYAASDTSMKAEEAEEDEHGEDKAPAAGKLLARGDGENTCLVTGEKLDEKTLFVTIQGKNYYVCCPGCKTKVQKHPEYYIKDYKPAPSAPSDKKPADEPKEKPAARFLARGDGETTCLVTGEKLSDKSLFVTVSGKNYYVCCPGCKTKVQKNPALYIKDYKPETE